MIIDEKVIPDDNTDDDAYILEHVAGSSLTMKMIGNSQERRESHWRTIMRLAGLEIRDIRVYTQYYDSVMVVVKKDGRTGNRNVASREYL